MPRMAPRCLLFALLHCLHLCIWFSWLQAGRAISAAASGFVLQQKRIKLVLGHWG